LDIREVTLDDGNVQELISKLDELQLGLYGQECCNLDSIDELKNYSAYMVGAYFGELLVGIGAIKYFHDYVEIKRMYFEGKYRGSGLANSLLERLEAHAKENEISTICLETGYLQAAALAFYRKHGYTEIHSFGTYKPNKVSIYLHKQLDKIHA